jgi:hypothetical protein
MNLKDAWMQILDIIDEAPVYRDFDQKDEEAIAMIDNFLSDVFKYWPDLGKPDA